MKKILVIDDDRAILNYLKIFLLQTEKYEVDVLQDSTESYSYLSNGNYDILLLDMDMPVVNGMDIINYINNEQIDIFTIVLTGVEDIDLAINAMKLGIAEYLLKPVEEDKLLSALNLGSSREKYGSDNLNQDNEKISFDSLKNPKAFSEIITNDRKLLQIFNHVEKFAETDNSILIWGESGAGKELIAKAIHSISKRKDNNFITVNAGAFSDELFTSEFFGHSRGSFTGAIEDKRGFLEEANHGTLFLDEIGELSLPMQVKLLRVLQEEEFYRIGSTKNMKIDVRIIAATNKDLIDEIHKGNFRKDLFFRLNINAIHMPSLRERRGDIEVLAKHFFEKYNKLYDKNLEKISPKVMKLLLNYDYPGNVRELMNVINSSIVVESGKELSKSSLPSYFLDKCKMQVDPLPSGEKLLSLQEIEKLHIIKVLKNTKNNKTLASKILGISRVSLISKVKKYNLEN